MKNCLFCKRKNTILCRYCKYSLRFKEIPTIRNGVDKLLIEIERVKNGMYEWQIPFNYRIQNLYNVADVLVKSLTKTTTRGR